MEWTTATIPKRANYTAEEIAEWDAITERRRTRFQPNCALDGRGALALMDKGAFYEQRKSEAGTVTICWIPKPDGRIRLAHFDSDCVEERWIVDALAAAVLEMSKQGTVYFYDPDGGTSGDSRVFQALAERLTASEVKNLTHAEWEVAA